MSAMNYGVCDTCGGGDGQHRIHCPRGLESGLAVATEEAFELRAEVASLRPRLAAAQSQISGLTSALQAVTRERDALERSRDAALAQIAAAQAERDQARQEAGWNADTIAGLQEALAAAEARAEEAGRRVNETTQRWTAQVEGIMAKLRPLAANRQEPEIVDAVIGAFRDRETEHQETCVALARYLGIASEHAAAERRADALEKALAEVVESHDAERAASMARARASHELTKRWPKRMPKRMPRGAIVVGSLTPEEERRITEEMAPHDAAMRTWTDAKARRAASLNAARALLVPPSATAAPERTLEQPATAEPKPTDRCPNCGHSPHAGRECGHPEPSWHEGRCHCAPSQEKEKNRG